ncbi:hypothetical protein ABPG72_004576 [Tetrahymena utriculariae]
MQQKIKAKTRLNLNPPIRGQKGCDYLKKYQFQLRLLLIISNLTFALEFEFFNQFFKRNAEEIVLANQNGQVYIDSNVSLYSSLLQGILISIALGYMRDFLSQAFTYYFGGVIMIMQNIFKLIFLSHPNYQYYIINLYMYGISNGIYQDNSMTLLMRFSYKQQNLFFTLSINLIGCIIIPKVFVFFIIQKIQWSYRYAIICSILVIQLLILIYTIPKIIQIYRHGKQIEGEEDPKYDRLWRISYSKAPLQAVLSSFFNRGSKRVLVMFIFLGLQIAFCQDQIYAGVKFFYSNDPSQYNGIYVSTQLDEQQNEQIFYQSSIIYIVSVLGLIISLMTGIYIDKKRRSLREIKYIMLINGLVLSTSFIILNFINHTDVFNLDYPNVKDIYNAPFYLVLFLSFLIGSGLGNCFLFAYLLILYGCPYKVKGTFLGVFSFMYSIIGIIQQFIVISLVDIISQYQLGAGIFLIFISFLSFFYIQQYPPRFYKQFVYQAKIKVIKAKNSNISVSTELSTSIN